MIALDVRMVLKPASMFVWMTFASCVLLLAVAGKKIK